MRQLKNNTLRKNLFYIILFLMITSSCVSGQRVFLGEENARDILKTRIANPNCHISIDSVTDSASFIKVIEPILIHGYGKEDMISARPYEIYHFGRYWVGKGTLAEVHPGGVFEIVLDAEKRKIIYIMHGK